MASEKPKRFNLIFRLICFLLVITSFTCVALSRYISSKTTSGKVGIEGFRGSVQVTQADHNSSFFNTEYHIGTSVMNHPYATEFKVSNCNLGADGKLITDSPSEVDLKYETLFYIPKDFAGVAAFQLSQLTYEVKTTTETTVTLTDKDGNLANTPIKTTEVTSETVSDSDGLKSEMTTEVTSETVPDNDGTELTKKTTTTTTTAVREIETQGTPVYTFADFLNAGHNDEVTMPKPLTREVTEGTETKTETYYESYGMILDLNENDQPTISEKFIIKFKGTADDKLALSATATMESGDTVTIEIEEETIEASVGYTFQCFDNKINNTADHLPVLLKPLEGKCTQEVTFYKVRISRPEFLLAKDVEETDTLRMRIIPTTDMGQYHVGTADKPETEKNNQRNEINMPFDVWYQNKRNSNLNPTFQYNKQPIDFETVYQATVGYFTVTEGDRSQNVYPNTCITKGRPMRINAIFMQASSS